jgi:ABC-type Na+ efflux pump permease subunit
LRLEQAGIDAGVVRLASQEIALEPAGLFTRDVSGAARAAEQRNEMTAIFLPMSCMMLMFMVIFMAAQPMLESVLEEKASRIMEVLLGCLNPTQLMLGKLLGTVAGSLTIFGVYLGGMLAVGQGKGMLSDLPWEVAPWFILFQVLGVLFFASIFMAVGASVSQLKEAQSMLLPVWLMLMLPMFVWFQVVREPNGPLAFWLTLIPPATPSMLVLRMATGATIPLWQVLLSLALLVAATWMCVVVAGRIFRVGILWQGKTPQIGELLRWGWGS